MVARRKKKADSIWWERRPSLEELRRPITPDEAEAALSRAAGSWRGTIDVDRLLGDIRWWRGHDD